MDTRIKKIIQQNFTLIWQCVELRPMISSFIASLRDYGDLSKFQDMLKRISPNKIDCSEKLKLFEYNLKGFYMWVLFEFNPSFAKPEAPSDLIYKGQKLSFLNNNPISFTNKLPKFCEFRISNLTTRSLQKYRDFLPGILMLANDPEPYVCKIYVQYELPNKSADEMDDLIARFQDIMLEEGVIIKSFKIHKENLEYYFWGFLTRNSLKDSSVQDPNSMIIKQISFDFYSFINHTEFCLHPQMLQIILFQIIFSTFPDTYDYDYVHVQPDIVTMPSISRSALSQSKPELALLHDFEMCDKGPITTYTTDIDYEQKFVLERLHELDTRIVNENKSMSNMLENIISYVNFAKHIRDIAKEVILSVGKLNTDTLKKNKLKSKEYTDYARTILYKDNIKDVSDWKGSGNILTHWTQMSTFITRYFASEPIHGTSHTSLMSPLGDQVYDVLIDGSNECPQDLIEELEGVCNRYNYPMVYRSSKFHKHILLYTHKVDTNFMETFSSILDRLERNVNVFTHVGLNVFVSCVMTKSETECVVDAMCIDMDSLHTPWITKIPILHLVCNIIYDNIIPFFIKFNRTTKILFNKNTLHIFEDVNVLESLEKNNQYIFQILDSKEQFMERYTRLYKEEDFEDMLDSLTLDDSESAEKKLKKKKRKEKAKTQEAIKTGEAVSSLDTPDISTLPANEEKQEKEKQEEKQEKEKQEKKQEKEKQEEKQEKQEEKQEKEKQEEKQEKEKQEEKQSISAEKNTQTISEWEDEYISKGFSLGYEACSKDSVKSKTNAHTMTDDVKRREQKIQVNPAAMISSTQTETKTNMVSTQTENLTTKIEEYNRRARERNQLQINPYLPLFPLKMGEKSEESANFPLEIQGSTYFFQNISTKSVLWNLLNTQPDRVKWLYMHGDEDLIRSLLKPLLEEPRTSGDILKIFLNK